MMEQMVNLTIDGQQIHCPGSRTVYEAATSAGIHIPTFCHHEKLEPVGACRMCLVEIEGARGLQTSCTTPVREGMVVKVHTSPAAVKARKANIEFLLTNHPLDCPVCDKGGECPLQNQAMQDGPGQSRYIEEKRHKSKRYPLGELMVLDQERCVLCWRCVRFLDEWADDHELDLFGRGANTRIDTFPGQPLRSKWQGNTIDICPVGALTSRVFRFAARVWELTDAPSICPMCPVGCNIVLGVKNNKLMRITPRENAAVNDTWICDKGRFTHAYVDHPDRLQTPLIRRDGELQPSTWEEATDLIVQRLGQVIQEDGPDAVAGLGSTRVTNEASYLFQRFLRTVVGTNNVDHLGRIPDGVLPLSSLPDLEHKDAILLLGFDPSTEAPLIELWLKKAVLRHGARVLVAGPRQIELGRYGGPFLSCRPGTEVAVLNGLARAIVDAGFAARTTRVTNLDDFRTWLQPYSPEQVERLGGASVSALREAARILSQAERPIILYGSDWLDGIRASESAPAKHNLEAIANLVLLLANAEVGFVPQDSNSWGALEMGVVPELFPGRLPFADNKVRSRLAGLWGGRVSPVAGLGIDGMMAAARDGSLKAMWIMGADPATESRGADEALGRVPFLIVQDLFLTDTASQAEVVLPAASFAETAGCYINLTGRLQPIQPGKRPPGSARPDWQIISDLATHMVDRKRRRFWDFAGPAEVMNEITKIVPGYRGVDCTALEDEGWQPPAPQAATRRSFVRTELQLPPEDPEYPFILVPGRLLYDRGTLLRRSERIQRLVPEAFVLIHPSDAQRLGLADGDDASVVSSAGRLRFKVKVSDEVVPGVAFAPRNLSVAPLSVLYTDDWTLPRVRIATV